MIRNLYVAARTQKYVSVSKAARTRSQNEQKAK